MQRGTGMSSQRPRVEMAEHRIERATVAKEHKGEMCELRSKWLAHYAELGWLHREDM